MENLNFKEIFIDFVKYGIPVISLLISILAYKKSKKINEIEIILKKYELEKKEKELDELTKACVDARAYMLSPNKCILKLWNGGKATAYEVDYKILEEPNIIIYKENTPYEYLEPGKHFENRITVFGNMDRKFKILIMWKDKEENINEKEQIITF